MACYSCDEHPSFAIPRYDGHSWLRRAKKSGNKFETKKINENASYQQFWGMKLMKILLVAGFGFLEIVDKLC
jgi:hypothetical protein